MTRRTALKSTTNHEVSINSGVDMFISHRTAINLSPRTIKWYTRTLCTIFKDMACHGLDLSNVRNVSSDVIEAYLIRRMQKGVKPVTLNGHIRSLNAFLRFMDKHGACLQPPITKLIRHEKRILDTFSQSQIAKMLKVCDNGRFTGMREKTAMMLMLETGIRASELTNIRISDVDLISGTVKVYGKGRKERLVPIQYRMANLLRFYLDERGGTLDTDYLFVTVDDRPLTLRTFEERIADVGTLAGIKGIRVSPHTFRHTFAKMYIQNGGDVFSLQKILGHTSLEMVRNYVNMFSMDVVTQHAKFSPVERMQIEIK